MKKFTARHREKVTGVLSCLDRMVFHGHLSINFTRNMYRFLRSKRVPLDAFGRFVNQQSRKLRQEAEDMARQAGRPCLYLQGFTRRKEDRARAIAQKDGITNGLVCIFRATEACRSYTLRTTPELHLRSSRRQCLHLYFYFIDSQLGWIHVRLQTWFPFLIQIGVNGHEILMQRMEGKGIAYTQTDNAFTCIEDIPRAQRIATGLPKMNWPRILRRVALKTNPLLRTLLRGLRYHWVTDQAEVATDVLFPDRASLQPLYGQLVKHSTLCFSAEDVLGFLGRRLHGLYKGQVVTETAKRQWGVRVKHRAGRNWVKMYDKAGSILRVETVINRAADFTVRRARRTRSGCRIQGNFPLPKGVSFLPHLFRIARRANHRYLDALAAVTDPAAACRDVQQIGKKIRRQGRPYRALNPLAPADRALFLTVLRGEHLINGFRNEHVRRRLYPRASDNPDERKRLSARIRRQLLLLRKHHLIARVPRTRRYVVTQRGYQLMSAAVFYCQEAFPKCVLNQGPTEAA
jgi:hypothetical protein